MSEPKSFQQPAEHLNIVYSSTNLNSEQIQKCIHALKYLGRKKLTENLTHRVIQALPHDVGTPTVIPVPLHPRKKARRGYNQAELLARSLATKLNLHTDTNLRRIKFTSSQTKLDESKRSKNIRGAFKYIGHAPRAVLLVDDVATTFATLNEAAAALKRRGCLSVSAVVVAKKY